MRTAWALGDKEEMMQVSKINRLTTALVSAGAVVVALMSSPVNAAAPFWTITASRNGWSAKTAFLPPKRSSSAGFRALSTCLIQWIQLDLVVRPQSPVNKSQFGKIPAKCFLGRSTQG